MIDIKKVKEALEKLKISNIYGLGHFLHSATEEENKILDQALNELERLQAKETPMKIGKIEEYGITATCKNVSCKRCNQATTFSRRQSVFGKYKPNYCSNCGQKLDWSELK